MFLYIAINKDRNTGYGVTVQIVFHIEGMLEDGTEPETDQPSLDTLIADPAYAGAQWFGIEINESQLIFKSDR